MSYPLRFYDPAHTADRPQALESFSARFHPRLALLDRERVERNVKQRVQRWAALGRGEGGWEQAEAALLAEDAAEVRQEEGGGGPAACRGHGKQSAGQRLKRERVFPAPPPAPLAGGASHQPADGCHAGIRGSGRAAKRGSALAGGAV